MLLVRKINPAKWKQELIDNNDINSDPVTIDLRTSGNTLSLWRIKDKTNLEEAILALASNFEKLGKMSVILLTEEELCEHNLELRNNEGNGKYFSYNQEHFDIIDLTYSKLNPISRMILKKVQTDDFIPFSRGDIKKILNEGIETGKLEKMHLHEKLQNELN